MSRPSHVMRDERPGDDEAIAPIGLFEMVLEVADLAASERFYRDVIGLPVVERWGDDRPGVWLALGREDFLGLWPPQSGGAVGIHGGRGGSHVHFALRLPMGALDTTRTRLLDLGYAVEERDFGAGNRAIYLDDPDGNVVELTERTTLWGGWQSRSRGGEESRR